MITDAEHSLSPKERGREMTLEDVICLETVLDHLTGEELGDALARLNAAPFILDAIFLTGIGKKNRPAGLLQVICLPENENQARDAVFRHTHALGLRRTLTSRWRLPRAESHATVAGETLPAKEHELAGEIYSRPEADALARLAEKLRVGMPALRFMKRLNPFGGKS